MGILGAPAANSSPGRPAGDFSGNWAAADSTGGSSGGVSGDVLVGAISFANLQPGFIAIQVGAFDDVLGPGGVALPFTLDAIEIVPEPGTVLLMGLGFVGLAAAGRRRN